MLNLEQVAGLVEKNRAAASARVKEFSVGGKKFNFNSQSAVMGVVNLSADSWYRESVCLSAETAIARGKILHALGADIIDVGAESTLAHAARADERTQNSKLIPVIKKLRAAKILVSVETYSPAVTRASLEAGANILNLTGTAASKDIFKMVADHDAEFFVRRAERIFCVQSDGEFPLLFQRAGDAARFGIQFQSARQIAGGKFHRPVARRRNREQKWRAGSHAEGIRAIDARCRGRGRCEDVGRDDDVCDWRGGRVRVGGVKVQDEAKHKQQA